VSLSSRIAFARGVRFFSMHGHNPRGITGRSYAGKIYLPETNSPTNTTARAVADTAEAVASKLPAAAAASAAGQLPLDVTQPPVRLTP
jgi:hypothetical protein